MIFRRVARFMTSSRRLMGRALWRAEADEAVLRLGATTRFFLSSTLHAFAARRGKP